MPRTCGVGEIKGGGIVVCIAEVPPFEYNCRHHPPHCTLIWWDKPDIPHHTAETSLAFIHMCSDKHMEKTQRLRKQQHRQEWQIVRVKAASKHYLLVCFSCWSFHLFLLTNSMSRLREPASPLSMTDVLLESALRYSFTCFFLCILLFFCCSRSPPA